MQQAGRSYPPMNRFESFCFEQRVVHAAGAGEVEAEHGMRCTLANSGANLADVRIKNGGIAQRLRDCVS